jgi:hypothetical protein
VLLLLLFVMSLCLHVLTWFDLVNETFALDIVLVSPAVGFIRIFVSVILVAIGVQEGSRGISRFLPFFMPLNHVVSGSMLTILIGGHL